MCSPSVRVTRTAMLRSWPLLIIQVLAVLGALSYFFLAGFLFLDFYEDVSQAPVAGLTVRTDTLDYVVHALGGGGANTTCASTNGPVAAFGSRFATGPAGSASLNFTPSCLSLDASLAAAAAVNLGGESRLPTSRVTYESIQLSSGTANDAAQLRALGFRSISSGATSVAGIRSSGSMYQTDSRFITVGMALNILAEGVDSSEPASVVDAFTGSEEKFAFKLVDQNGNTVSRCLRPDTLAADLTNAANLTSAEVSSKYLVACTATAGQTAHSRPVMTLDALMHAAGLSNGLGELDTALLSTGEHIPYHLAGMTLDVELVYDNLPDLGVSPDPKPMTVTAGARLIAGRPTSWISSSFSTVDTYTALPQAAHLSVKASAPASCQALSWSSSSTDVAACIAAAGSAAAAFDTQTAPGHMVRREETFGVVLRATPSGRIVAFTYTALAALAVQALAKYASVMSVVVVVTLMCWPTASDAVFTTVEDDEEGGTIKSTTTPAGSKGSTGGGSGDADDKTAPAALESVSAAFKRQQAAEAAEEDRIREEEKFMSEAKKHESKEEEMDKKMVKMEGKLKAHDDALHLIIGDKQSLLVKANKAIALLDKRVKALTEMAEPMLKELYGEVIEREAAKAARDAVFLALTGKKEG